MSAGPASTSETPAISWNCQFQELGGAGAGPLTALTVGTRFALECQGSQTVEWQPDAWHLSFPKEEFQYTLHILEVVEAKPNAITMVVTGYKPGEFTPEWVDISDGSHVVRSQGLRWTIKSILNPQGENKPYPLMGPMYLHWPIWLWITAAIFFLTLLGLTVRWLRRRGQRKKMLQELATHQTALSPYNQFHKDLRQLVRRLHTPQSPLPVAEAIQEIDQHWRMYLLREFLVPANQWPDRAILQDIKSHHQVVYQNERETLRKLFVELGRAKQASARMQVNDCEQLVAMARSSVDRIYQHVRKEQKP